MRKRKFSVVLTVAILIAVQLTHAVDFVYNGFDDDDASAISLYSNATIESNILTLTTDVPHSIGRALYRSKIPAKEPNTSKVLPFSTSFIFAMEPYRDKLAGHGIVFLFVPKEGIEGAMPSQNLGFLNFTNDGDPNNHVFGVEFDCFRNQEFRDIDANHVGVDVNSLASVRSHEAGYWLNDNSETSFQPLDLNSGRTYQVWIDYADNVVNVTMAPAGLRRPKTELLSVFVNLSQVFLDEMYVGFTASTGNMVQSHKILAWSFSNSNFSLSSELITAGLPSFEPPPTPRPSTTAFIAGAIVGAFFVVLLLSVAAYLFGKRRRRRIRKQREETEDWELEYWPHRISYQEIESATNNFSDENVIGIGSNGKVHRGIFSGGLEVAVKRIPQGKKEGIREFLAEISSLGRVKHRNLVGLIGWCKKDKDSLILVYEYMENGSLDKILFDEHNNENDETAPTLPTLDERIRILKQVAVGVLYLHDGWVAKVLHRDIKASNVLLDREMNAKLGDFGLARMHEHDMSIGTTRVVGTVGYLAPEIVKNGRSSTKSDVYSYGVLVLEAICGRRPIEEGDSKPPLVEWVWQMSRKGELVNAADGRLRANEGFDGEKAERVLHLGLLCAHPDENVRPRMREVVKFFEGRSGNEGGEEMDRYLLMEEKVMGVSGDILSTYYDIFYSNGNHPTFDEVRRGMSSASISWADSTTAHGGR